MQFTGNPQGDLDMLVDSLDRQITEFEKNPHVIENNDPEFAFRDELYHALKNNLDLSDVFTHREIAEETRKHWNEDIAREFALNLDVDFSDKLDIDIARDIAVKFAETISRVIRLFQDDPFKREIILRQCNIRYTF